MDNCWENCQGKREKEEEKKQYQSNVNKNDACMSHPLLNHTEEEEKKIAIVLDNIHIYQKRRHHLQFLFSSLWF